MTTPELFDPGSFRDREGRVCIRDGRVLRALSASALDDWRALSQAEFFRRAVADGRVVETWASDVAPADLGRGTDSWAGVIEHQRVPFVSYPYEWTFDMLRDAALLHLDLMGEALREGFILKDSSPYNIQWIGSKPLFIDTPSFQRWTPGEAWVGYRQFCQMFLYPLLMAAHRDLPFQPWLRGAIDGITPDDCRRLMSFRDLFRRGVFAHVYLQSRLLAVTANSRTSLKADLKRAQFGKKLIENNIRGMQKVVSGLRWRRSTSEWTSYEEDNSYTAADESVKRSFVVRSVATSRWNLVWDLGCNLGAYSRMAAEQSRLVVAMDGDHLAANRLYLDLKTEGCGTILPLVVNLADASPNIGWRGRERRALFSRGQADLVLCLALIHHMVIGANVPLAEFVDWLASLGSHLLIEFPTREDGMVKKLLLNRTDIYHDYALEIFERELNRHFHVIERQGLPNGTRALFFARPMAEGARQV